MLLTAVNCRSDTAQCTYCKDPTPHDNCASTLHCFHAQHWQCDLKWCSQLIELLQSPLKPVAKEITKMEWAVCQLYPPSKKTFGACYWVPPEQEWTSLNSEVVLSAVLPCDLPQWGVDGEVRGGQSTQLAVNIPAGGTLSSDFFSAVEKKRKGKWQYIRWWKWVRSTALSPSENITYYIVHVLNELLDYVLLFLSKHGAWKHLAPQWNKADRLTVHTEYEVYIVSNKC